MRQRMTHAAKETGAIIYGAAFLLIVAPIAASLAYGVLYAIIAGTPLLIALALNHVGIPTTVTLATIFGGFFAIAILGWVYEQGRRHG